MGDSELAIFAGAGGGVWASILLGHRIVGYVEHDKYCQDIIRQRIRDGVFDDAPLFSDIRDFDGRPYCNRVDIISAGFPCQPFSVAGKRAGENDKRNMWPDTIRIIREIRPQFAFLENVPGLLASRYFGTVLKDLAESGYNAQWTVLGASDLGAPHRRKRLWILAYPAIVGLQKERSSTWIRPKGSSSGSWWATEPNVGRVAHGVAHRVDRLKALGNGQVPILAATAFKRLIYECYGKI